MEQMWAHLCGVENDIQKTLKCDHRDLLPNLHSSASLYGASHALHFSRSGDNVVVTPILQFHTRQQLEGKLGELQKALLYELEIRKPKAIGNLWVACSVNPGQMCYELVMAVPFSQEE
jgi:hypothetical protein